MKTSNVILGKQNSNITKSHTTGDSEETYFFQFGRPVSPRSKFQQDFDSLEFSVLGLYLFQCGGGTARGREGARQGKRKGRKRGRGKGRMGENLFLCIKLPIISTGTPSHDFILS